MGQAASILLSAFFTAGACWAAGKILLSRCRATLYREEWFFFRFVAGSACLSLLVFALTAAHLAYRWIFAVVGIGLIAAAAKIRTDDRNALPLPDYPTRWKIAFRVIYLVYGVYYVVNAMAPEASPDGSGYHLGLVSRYLLWHGFGHITTDIYASLSQGLEMLFLFAFAFGRHSAAAMVEFAFLLMLPLGMLGYARRFGFPRAGVFGALLVFVTPVVGISGTVAYNDVAGVCVLFASFYLAQIWALSRERDLVWLIGLLAGFCYGIKYTLFLAVPFLALFLITKRSGWRPLAILAASAGVMIAPWMVKNWLVVQNPLSPFFNQWFPNPYVTVGFEKDYTAMMGQQDDLTPAQRPLEQTVQGGRTAGFVGPIFLLAPLALLALRFSAGRQLLLAGAVFLVPAFTNLQTRFLMPSLPFFSLALGLALMEAGSALWVLLLFEVVVCWPRFTGNYCTSYAWRLAEFPLAEATRKIPEEKTLAKRLPWLPVSKMIQAQVPENGKVFTFSSPPEAYTTRNIVISYESALGEKLADFLYCAALPEFRPTQMLEFPFQERTVRRLRVVQLAKRSQERWSVAEVRIFHQRQQLQRSRDWRMRAEPNNFDVALAFDNQPVTRWSSVQALDTGMQIEVEFGHPVEVDEVVLETSHDQWSVRLRVDAETEPGVWRTVSSDPSTSTGEPKSNLRRAATMELRARGITHLLVAPDNLAFADFVENASSWGLKLVGTAADARLYRLEP